MPIELVLSDVLKKHVADCPTIEVLDERITTHNIDESSHGYVVGKVSTLQSVIPGTATPFNKLITDSDLQAGLDSVYVPGAMVYRGVLADETAIKAVVNPVSGDYYQAADTGMFWIYNGTEWESTTSMVDLTDYYTKPEVDTVVSKESDKLEAEIKKILDDYTAEHGGDSNEWVSIFPNSSIEDGPGTFTLDVDLKEVKATEVIVFFRLGSASVPFRTASCTLPITDDFYPQGWYTNYTGSGTVYNGGSVSYNGFVANVGTQDTDGAFATFYFPTYKTIEVDIDASGYLSGVFYKSTKPNVVISYYKDPIIVAANEPDYTQKVSIDTTEFYPSTVSTTGAVFGKPFVAPEPCYICMRPQFTFDTDQANAPMITINIDGESVIANNLAIRYFLNGNKVFKWNYENLFVDAGQSVTFGIAASTASTLSVPVKYAWYYKTKGAILDSTEAAFNQHTQNTSIHITHEEKASVDTIPALVEGIAAIHDSLSTTTASLATLDVTVNDQHIPTDRFRWQDIYNDELSIYKELASANGLKPDITPVLITSGIDYTVTDPYGGLISVKATNANNQIVTVTKDGSFIWSSDGLMEGVSVTKYFRALPNTIWNIVGTEETTYVKAVEDVNNPTRIAMSNMSQSIADNKAAILTVNARLSNKKPSGVMEDIETAAQGSGYTVPENASLGGRIHGKGVNALLGSTGTVDVTNSQGTVEVYNNLGLLSLLAPVPVLVEDVADGDVITCSGMAELFYEKYIAG